MMMAAVMRNDRGAMMATMDYEASLVEAAASRAKRWDRDPEGARTNMTVTTMTIWRPSAAREVAEGSTTPPDLSARLRRELFLGFESLASALTKVLMATFFGLKPMWTVKMAMLVMIGDAVGWAGTKASGNMRTSIIMIMKDIRVKFQGTLDVLDNEMTPTIGNNRHRAVYLPM